jgi:hypothetical protein
MCNAFEYTPSSPPEANAHMPSRACDVEKVKMDLLLGRHCGSNSWGFQKPKEEHRVAYIEPP